MKCCFRASFTACACFAGVGNTFFSVQFIRDFPADEARQFFQFFDTLVEGGKVSEEDWEQVCQVSLKHTDVTVIASC